MPTYDRLLKRSAHRWRTLVSARIAHEDLLTFPRAPLSEPSMTSMGRPMR